MSYYKLQKYKRPHVVDYPPIWAPQLYGGAYADCLYKKNQHLVRSGYRWPPGIEGCRDEPYRYRRGGVRVKEGFAPVSGRNWSIIQPRMGFRRWYGRVDPPTLPGRKMALTQMQSGYIKPYPHAFM